jgi:uncharacterized protein (DUF433 family)
VDTLPDVGDPACQAALINDHIEFDPSRPGVVGARLVESAIPVWAIIGYLKVAEWSVPAAARAYDVSQDAVRAAVAYYALHPQAIDAKLEAIELAAT